LEDVFDYVSGFHDEAGIDSD